MNPRRQAVIHQQQHARRYTSNTDAYAFFNLLTSIKGTSIKGTDLFFLL